MKYTTILLIAILIFSGCTTKVLDDSTANNAEKSQAPIANIDKLEIYHFHGNQQCFSCKTIGAYAEETVNTYFSEELESGKIVFDHINYDLYQNKDLATKYKAAASSLWLGTYSENEFYAEENTNVWYKIKDKDAYMEYLKEVIETKLAGK